MCFVVAVRVRRRRSFNAFVLSRLVRAWNFIRQLDAFEDHSVRQPGFISGFSMAWRFPSTVAVIRMGTESCFFRDIDSSASTELHPFA